MIINISGYGYSGASAYRDLLKEFSDTTCFPAEFQLLQEPDGLLDLEYGLVLSPRRINSNTVICRFRKNIFSVRHEVYAQLSKGKYYSLTNDYLTSLVQASWFGRSMYDPIDICSIYTKGKIFSWGKRCAEKICRHIGLPPRYDRRYYSSMPSSEFVQKTRQYIHDLLDYCGYSLDNYLILEQAFGIESPLNGAHCFACDVKSIVVDRDPRDVFILTNKIFKSKSSFMPNSGDVEQFVRYYKTLHRSISNDDQVRYFSFEDLLFDYDRIVEELSSWLGIGQNRNLKFRYFDPACSVANTKLYEKYTGLEMEIGYIERELHEYLYPFGKKPMAFKSKYSKVFDRQSDIVGDLG